MKIYYDDKVDALYIKLGTEKPEGVSELSDGVNLDLTKSGKLVGIEIINASKKTSLKSFLSYSIESGKALLAKTSA